MDERTIKQFKNGDLIKWYVMCGDNIVVLDAGTGVVIEKSDSYSSNYQIYRNEKKDIMKINSYYLESLK
jgi:hypothetical protein